MTSTYLLRATLMLQARVYKAAQQPDLTSQAVRLARTLGRR